MMTAFPTLLFFALMTFGLGAPAWAQVSSPVGAGRLRFEFVQGNKVTKETMDSFVVLKSERGGAQVAVAFNNPCRIRPEGRYSVAADTLSILLDHRPHLSREVACPGSYEPEEFIARIRHLRPRHYIVRVVFQRQGTLWPDHDLWREIDVD